MIEFAIAELARSTFGGSALEGANRNVVSNAVDSIAEFAERSYGRTQPEGNGREPIACKPGCNYCCHMRVVASVPEVIALADFIAANFPAGAIEAIRRRAAETDEKTHGLSDEQWGAGRFVCPLLAEGRCSVYAARPLDCRGYNSTSLAACRAASLDYGEWDVPMENAIMTAFKSAQAGLLQALAGTGRRPRLVELTAALRIVLEDAAAIDRWLAGENPFADAELDPSDPEQRAFLPWVPSDELRAAAEAEDLP
jgi:Putative zinc- or iron-chelating domain